MIATARLKLRKWRDADRLPLAAIHADPQVMKYLGGVKSSLQSNEIVDRLMQWSEEGEPFFWAVERVSDGALLGAVGLHRIGPEFSFGPALEVGWRLGRDYWGRGYANESASAALDYAFANLGAAQVYAFTALNNSRSEAVMQRLGMKKVHGGEFPHPDLPPCDPLSMHTLYVAERH